MEVATECEYEEKRASFHSARAAVKLLPSKISGWKIKDNISKLRLDVKDKLEDEKLKELLVDTRVHDALAKFFGHTI